MLERIVVDLRTLAHGVRPERLDDGLSTALRSLIADAPMPVDLRIDDVDVPEQVAATIYYVVSEGLMNAYKHATTQQVLVSVAGSGSRVVLEVTDDGVGGASNGFGVTSLRDRVAAVGGQFFLDSPVGGGTVIRAEF